MMELIKAKRTGLHCQQCGEHFYPRSKRGFAPKFCSNACKQKSYRESKKAEGIQTISRPKPNIEPYDVVWHPLLKQYVKVPKKKEPAVTGSNS